MTPITGVSTTFVMDLTESSRLAQRVVEMLSSVPLDDRGSEATKDLRVRVYKTNLAVQKRLEKQVGAGNPEAVLSELRKADAYLEDANWQLQKKPSPDGRFDGVDVSGAMRDLVEGVRIIDSLLIATGGRPTTTTPVDPPVHPPSGPPAPPHPPTRPGPPVPTFPPTPPTDPEPTDPTGPGPVPPTAPPSGPTPPSGGPDPDYPGEDEFPTDDKILNGGGSGGDS